MRELGAFSERESGLDEYSQVLETTIEMAGVLSPTKDDTDWDRQVSGSPESGRPVSESSVHPALLGQRRSTRMDPSSTYLAGDGSLPGSVDVSSPEDSLVGPDPVSCRLA